MTIIHKYQFANLLQTAPTYVCYHTFCFTLAMGSGFIMFYDYSVIIVGLNNVYHITFYF